MLRIYVLGVPITNPPLRDLADAAGPPLVVDDRAFDIYRSVAHGFSGEPKPSLPVQELPTH